MRVAVYGGSFDPPHVGHAMVAAWLRWTDQCDEVWWVPVFGHPFAKDSAPFATRLAWCRAVAATLPDTVVDPIEAELPTPSYTIDTLRALRARHPEHTFRLVVGADVLGQTDRWKAWDAIEAEFRPLAVGRSGYPTPEGALAFPAVSSTEIRRRARAGEPLDALVPAVIRAEVRAAYAPPQGPTVAAPTSDPPDSTSPSES